MTSYPRIARALIAALLACAALGCEREVRRFEPSPSADVTAYDQNAYALSQGKQLFTWFNCVGCHSHGGGGMGPALMDRTWIYGAEPADIFDSIIAGRPNGMPAYGGRITDDQAWQLAAYVRALAGLARFDAAPGRNDGMSVRPAEQRMPAQRPDK